MQRADVIVPYRPIEGYAYVRSRLLRRLRHLVRRAPGGRPLAIHTPRRTTQRPNEGSGRGGRSAPARRAARSRYEEVVDAVKQVVESLKVGDPQDPDTFIGPMIRRDQQQRVRDYIEIGIKEGARLVTGGPQVPTGLERGHYVTPTIFADVDNTMRIAQEEIFGPVLVVIAYQDEDDAVRIANDSEYGLSGGVWSTDEQHALAIARRIRTGTMTVNGAPIGFDGPFGGFKASSLGREYGFAGLNTYLEYKTVTL